MNSNRIAEIEQIISEVNNAVEEFYKISDVNDEINDLAYGWRIFFSPLIFNPNIMFIGINPGSGWEGVDIEYNDKKHIEYLDGNFRIANETKAVFKKAGCYNLLEESVKINYYFLSTYNVQCLDKILQLMNTNYRADYTKIFESRSRDWTSRLIKIINPKIIICEGKYAFDKIKALYGEQASMDDDCETFKPSNQKLVVIGYKRHFSNILNKERLKGLLIEAVKIFLPDQQYLQ